MPHLQPTRRGLLRAGAALPACLAPAFGGELSEDEARRAARAAWRRTQLVGQPLFLIVVPEDAPRRATATGLWTNILSGLPNEALITLAACEVHATTLQAAAAAFERELEHDEADVLALLVDPLDAEVQAIEHDARLRPPTPPGPHERGPGSPGPVPGFSTWARRWTSELEKLVGDNWHATQRRYGQAWAAPLPGDLDLELRELIHVRRAFIQQRAFKPAKGLKRNAWLQVLGAQARARLVQSGPSGTRWTEQAPERPTPGPIGGCTGGPCGTGHFPPRARRLLEFYTQR